MVPPTTGFIARDDGQDNVRWAFRIVIDRLLCDSQFRIHPEFVARVRISLLVDQPNGTVNLKPIVAAILRREKMAVAGGYLYGQELVM